MSEAQSPDTEDEQSYDNPMVPLRISERNTLRIGDYEQGLFRAHGRTRGIVWTTPESAINCRNLNDRDKAFLATYFSIGTSFDSLEQEAQADTGRHRLMIVLDEGERAYEEMEVTHKMNDPYLYAYAHQITVEEASEKSDGKPSGAILTDDGMRTFRTGDLDFLRFEVRHDGEIYEMDIREFVPDREWMEEYIDRRIHTGHGFGSSNLRDQDVEKFEGMLREGDDTTEVLLNASKDGLTVHEIAEVEEALVADEPDLIRSTCGYSANRDTALVLEIDTDTLEERALCGSCHR